MTTLLLFLGVLSVLILIHEAGHLLIAKLSGVWVHQFSIGFGPDLFSFRKNETLYSLKPILIGGYVKMAGEDVGTEESKDEEVPEDRKLYSQHPLIKSAIASAGSITNILFAVLLTIAIIGVIGVPQISIYGILEDSPSKGLIQRGDIIQAIKGKSIHSTRQINTIVQKNGEEKLAIRVNRNGETVETTVKPHWYEDEGRFMIGVSLGPAGSPRISDLAEDSLLKKRGLKKGDLISAINGEKVYQWADIIHYLQKYQGEKIRLTVKRGGEPKRISIPEGKKLNEILKGVAPRILRKKTGPITSIKLGIDQIKTILITTYRGLKMVIGGKIAAKNAVSGPVGIANYLGKGLEQGAYTLFTLIALISLNLGLVNLIPFPALDGSRIGFAFYELIVGKPIPPEKEGMIHSIGFVILIGLLIFLTYQDIMRIFQ